ncbi:MAG TPA: hypothetical protein VEQ60_12150 [Longimicrobium sp.]|nr:hypothetical protein [Longimicrobium sp.]
MPGPVLQQPREQFVAVGIPRIFPVQVLRNEHDALFDVKIANVFPAACGKSLNPVQMRFRKSEVHKLGTSDKDIPLCTAAASRPDREP